MFTVFVSKLLVRFSSGPLLPAVLPMLAVATTGPLLGALVKLAP